MVTSGPDRHDMTDSERLGSNRIGEDEVARPPLFTSVRLIKPLLLGVVVLIILLAISDMGRIVRIFAELSLFDVFVAIAMACMSYLCITFSYRELFRMIDVRMRFSDLFTVTVISTLINYFIASGGFSGYALRAVLFKKRGVQLVTTFSASLLQGVLTNVTILALFLVSFILFVIQTSLSIMQIYILVLPMAFLVFFVSFIVLVLFHRNSTDRIMIVLRRLIVWIEKKRKRKDDQWSRAFDRMVNQFIEASELFRKSKRLFWLPFTEVLFDWIFSMICLGFCFEAINHPLPWTVIATVYFVGIFISFVFVASGGLGLMEGGMAAVFTMFDVPWEAALSGVILYRIVYYFFPLLIILPSYIRFVRSCDQTDDQR